MEDRSKSILDAYFTKACPCNDEQFCSFVEKNQGGGSEDGFQVVFIHALMKYPKFILDNEDKTLSLKADEIRNERDEYVMGFATCSVCHERWVHVGNEWRMGATADRLMPTIQEPLDPEMATVRYAELSAQSDNPWKAGVTTIFKGWVKMGCLTPVTVTRSFILFLYENWRA